MKIAVSSVSNNDNGLLDSRFGRCGYFIIYDTVDGFLNAIENKGSMSGGGAGIAAAQQVIDEGVDAVITGNMGPNAFNLLQSSDIKVFKCEETHISAAVKLLKDGKLEELTKSGPAHAGMGSGSGAFRGGN